MTYFEFLFWFLGVPLALLALITIRDRRAGIQLPAGFRTWPPAIAVAVHVLVAIVYTTPWDNYLVATNVWWYDPQLVSGVTIGWVPIEEYTFFVLQTIMTGLWLLLLARHMQPSSNEKLLHPVKGQTVPYLGSGRMLRLVSALMSWSCMAVLRGHIGFRLAEWHLSRLNPGMGASTDDPAACLRSRHPVAPSPPVILDTVTRHVVLVCRRRAGNFVRYVDDRPCSEHWTQAGSATCRRDVVLCCYQHHGRVWHNPRTGPREREARASGHNSDARIARQRSPDR